MFSRNLSEIYLYLKKHVLKYLCLKKVNAFKQFQDIPSRESN